IRLWLEQPEPHVAHPYFGELAVELRAKRAAVSSRQLVHDHPADVVARALVLPARVAETCDEQIERRGAFPPTSKEVHLALGLFFAARLCRRLALCCVGLA